MTLLAIEQALDGLAPAEKAELLQRLALAVARVWPGVERRSDSEGRTAFLVRTRIPVWLLDSYRRLGWSDARVLANYPSLRAVDLVQAWSYADAHSGEIDEAIARSEAA